VADQDEARVGRVRLTAGRVLALFAFGSIVVTTLDGFHTWSDTTRYASPVVLRAAWWAFLTLGLAAAGGGSLYALLYQSLGGRKPPPPWSQLAPGFAIFVGLYAFSGFFHGPSETKLIVLGVGGVALFLWLDRTLAGVACAVVTAFAGTLSEIVAGRTGAFEYLRPDFLGVPFWLPALYVCAAATVGQGARRWLIDPRSPSP
jgi:hypothetical protein